MISFLRRLFSRDRSATTDAAAQAWDPHLFVYVKIPGDIQPLVRGERFEDPLEEILQAQGLGTISGGGSQLDDPYPNGSPRVEYCGIDIDVTDREKALIAIRLKLSEFSAPTGTEIHYTEENSQLLDRLEGDAWQLKLQRTFKHPGFGV